MERRRRRRRTPLGSLTPNSSPTKEPNHQQGHQADYIDLTLENVGANKCDPEVIQIDESDSDDRSLHEALSKPTSGLKAPHIPSSSRRMPGRTTEVLFPAPQDRWDSPRKRTKLGVQSLNSDAPRRPPVSEESKGLASDFHLLRKSVSSSGHHSEQSTEELASSIWDECRRYLAHLSICQEGLAPHRRSMDHAVWSQTVHFNEFVATLSHETILESVQKSPSTKWALQNEPLLERRLRILYDLRSSDDSKVTENRDTNQHKLLKYFESCNASIKRTAVGNMSRALGMSQVQICSAAVETADRMETAIRKHADRFLQLQSSSWLSAHAANSVAPTKSDAFKQFEEYVQLLDEVPAKYARQLTMANTYAQAPFLKAENDFESFLDELQADDIDENEGTNTAQEVLEAAQSIGAERLPDGKFDFIGLRCTLHPHQVIGVSWMSKREARKDDQGTRSKVRGGILADAMGLGKTVQALGVMIRNQPSSVRAERFRPRTTLIVCPVALIHQWAREIVQKAPGLFANVRVHHGAAKLRSIEMMKRADVIITSYGTLAREYPIRKLPASATAEERIADWDRIERDKGLLFRMQFYRFILDEAHTIKNPAANVSVACCNIDAIRQWCLTGTPLQNKVDDIFPLLSILQVPYFSDRSNFRKEITNTESGANRLRGVLAPFVLRRNKDDKIAGQKVLTLPEKFVKLKILDLDEDEKAIYKQVEGQMVTEINKYLQEGTAVKKFNHIFIMILRLRQLCIHPYLILEHLATKEKFDRAEFLKNADSMHAFADLFANGFDNDSSAIICAICADIAVDALMSRACRHCFCKSCVRDSFGDEEFICPDCSRLTGSLVQYDPRLHQAASSSAEDDRGSITHTRLRLLEHPHLDHKPVVPKAESATDSASDKFETSSFKSEIMDVSDEDAIKNEAGDKSSGSIPRRTFISLHDESEDEELPDLRITANIYQVSIKPEPGVKIELEHEIKSEPLVKEEASSETNHSKPESSVPKSEPDPLKATMSRPSASQDGLPASETQPDSAHRPRYIPHVADVGDGPPQKTREQRKAEEENWRELLKLDLLPSTKLTAVEDQLRAWMTADGSKLIVFSQFVRALDLLAKICETNEWPILRYQGNMNMREREDTIAQFEEPEGPRILLMSLKAGGVGLNLVCASKVLMLDFWWNAAVEHQAVDRCHRMGQVKEVVVIRTYFPGTVEEKILKLQEAKLKTAGTVLGENEGGGKMAKLGLRELLSLFGRVTTDAHGVQQIEASHD